MRSAHILSSLTAAASLAAASAAWALPPVADPAAATAALQHRPLPASGGVETTSMEWRDANAAVGAFPRGHADLLRWEAAQSAQAGQPAATSRQQPGHHGQHHAPAAHGGKP
jgi:hypothetical protein